MGTCSCVQEDKRDSDEVVKESTRMARPMQQATYPAVQAAITKEEVLFEDEQKRKNTLEVTAVQTVVRTYLARKRARTVEGAFVQWTDIADPIVERGETTTIDPMTLLSEPAKDTYRRLLDFKYDQRIAGVHALPPQRLADGSIYVGEWVTLASGLCRKGRGRLYHIDHSLSEGYWLGGLLHSSGRVISPNGDYYEGGFALGKRAGAGTFKSYDGLHTYTGGWDNDCEHGYGNEVINGEVTYEGAFVHSDKTGEGKFRWRDGSSYSGTLLKGQIDGAGEYRWADGRRYVGQWREGKLHGQGEFDYGGGKSYKGSYVMDKKEGFGVYTWEGKVYAGPWVNNRMHGIGELTANGERKKFEFNEGKKGREIVE